MDQGPDKPNTDEQGAGTPPEDVGSPPLRLLDRIRERIRYKHYSVRTERPYVEWARRFILFHGKRHPSALGTLEIEAS